MRAVILLDEFQGVLHRRQPQVGGQVPQVAPVGLDPSSLGLHGEEVLGAGHLDGDPRRAEPGPDIDLDAVTVRHQSLDAIVQPIGRETMIGGHLAASAYTSRLGSKMASMSRVTRVRLKARARGGRWPWRSGRRRRPTR